MTAMGKVGILVCVGAVCSYAETWTGKVMDAACYDTRKTAEHKSNEEIARACAPTATTTDFAIQTSAGKVYKVDSSGNSELAKDIRNGVLKKDKDGDIHATVTGSLDGETMKVTTIELQK